LAWGGEEGRVLFYDAAKNLRLARDMARAGGFFGNYLNLPLPSEVRSNIHTDLMTSYIIGFFGWAVFAILMLAYLLFYSQLFSGLYRSLLSTKVYAQAVSARFREGRRFLLNLSAALVLTFAFQALYVISATLQNHVPFTGLDLQPVSTSAISVISFFVVLLGSVALTHTFNQTLIDSPQK
jgi:hypothetical protein